MKQSWTTAGALAVAIVMQVMIAPHIRIAGVVPNLILPVVITLAFVEGPSAGLLAGFSGGLMFDLLGAAPIGAWALVMAVTGYASGMLQENLFAEGWLAPVTTAIVAGLIAETAYLLLLTFVGAGPAFWASLWQIVLPAAIYNAALVLLAYPWLARFLRTDRSMKSFGRLA